MNIINSCLTILTATIPEKICHEDYLHGSLKVRFFADIAIVSSDFDTEETILIGSTIFYRNQLKYLPSGQILKALRKRGLDIQIYTEGVGFVSVGYGSTVGGGGAEVVGCSGLVSIVDWTSG